MSTTRLHPQRAVIEQALAARERTLFNLHDTIYLYDLDRRSEMQRGRLLAGVALAMVLVFPLAGCA